ncbi:MAG: amidohydrolase [Candidatus Thermoplasmatota archaeon]|nr:amidohydrolase [Candidatus Thermoplasmatota archaeon]
MDGRRKRRGLLLENANVITLDPNTPRATAVLCRDGLIEAVGEVEDLEKMVREGDSRFDCGELTLVPGFIDSHCHFMSMGLSALRVDLTDMPERAGIIMALRMRAEDTREGEWVFGVDFDETRWDGDRTLPTRDLLDRLVSDRHPVVARRICGHIAVANTMALERIGDEWREVDRETGLLLEDVVLRLSDIVGVTDEEVRQAIALATRRAHEEGVTSIVDMADLRTLRAYRDLDDMGMLRVRVFCKVQAREVQDLTSEDIPPADVGRMLRLAGIKAFLDGSLGARTAALSDPYSDDPENLGMLLYDPPELAALVRGAEATGLQISLHAIGDRAVGAALDAFSTGVAHGNPLRHRIEHLEYATSEQQDRMKALRIVASMQPNFIVQWSGPGGMNEQRLGTERAHASEALRDIWSKGIPLAFGSDNMPFGPLYGLQGAVHHPVEDQQLPPMVALRAYTAGSAWAVHAETWLGTIEPGKAADLALLDADPDEAGDLTLVKVVATVLAGDLVHVDTDGFNRAVDLVAQRALEEALMDADLPRLDLEGPREDDEADE